MPDARRLWLVSLVLAAAVGWLEAARAEPIPCAARADRDTTLIGRGVAVSGPIALDSSEQVAVVPATWRVVLWHIADNSPVLEVVARCGEVAIAELDEATCQVVAISKGRYDCPTSVTRWGLDAGLLGETVLAKQDAVALSPDGHWLVTRSSWASGVPDGALSLVDTRTGASVATTKARHDGRVAVRDDGLVANVEGATARLLRASGGSLEVVFEGTLGAEGTALAFAVGGGSLLAGDRSGRLYRWIAPDWRPAHPSVALERAVGAVGWLPSPGWLYAADATALDDFTAGRTPRLRAWDASGGPLGAVDILFARQALLTRRGVAVRDSVRELRLAPMTSGATPPREHNGRFVETLLVPSRIHFMPDGTVSAVAESITGADLVRWAPAGPTHQSASTGDFVRRGDRLVETGSRHDGEPFAGGRARVVHDLEGPERVVDDRGRTVFTLPAEAGTVSVREDADVVVWRGSVAWSDTPFFVWRFGDRKVRRSPPLPGDRALVSIAADGGSLVLGGATHVSVVAVGARDLRVVREVELGEPLADAAIAGDVLVLLGGSGLLRRVSSAGATMWEVRASQATGALALDVQANLLAARDQHGGVALYDLGTGAPRGTLWDLRGQSDVAGDALALGWIAVSADGAIEGNAVGFRRVTIARGLAPRPTSELGPSTQAGVLRRVLGAEAVAEPAGRSGSLTLSDGGGAREGSAESTYWLSFVWRSEAGAVPHRFSVTRAGETVWSKALGTFEPEMRLTAPLSLDQGDNVVEAKAHDATGAVIASARTTIVGRRASGVDQALALQTPRGAWGRTLGAFSPDGRHFAMLSSDGVVRIWDVATGLTAMTLTGAGGAPSAIGWSPDGLRVAARTTRREKDSSVAGDLVSLGREVDVVTIWTFPSGRLATSLLGQSSTPADAWLGKPHDAYKRTPIVTERWVATPIRDDRGDFVEVTRPRVTGEPEVVARLPSGLALAASTDGRLLALVGQGTAAVYETRGWTLIQTYAPDLADAFDFSFTERDDGVRFAKGDALYRLSFDSGEVAPEADVLTDQERLHTGPCITDFVVCRRERFAPTPKGLLVASPTALRMHDRREHILQWADQPDFANVAPSIVVDPQGRVAAIVRAEPIVVELATGTRAPLPSLATDRSSVFRVALANGGTTVAALIDDEVSGLDLPSQGERLMVTEPRATSWRSAPTGPPSTAVAGLSASGVVVGDVNGQVRVLDTRSMQYRAGWPSHALAVTAITIAPREDVAATAGEEGLVRLVDVASGKALHLLEGHRAAVTELAFSHDGQRLLSASRDGTFRLWGVADGRLQVIGVPGQGGRLVLVAPDGSYFAPRSELAQVGFRTESGVVPYDALDFEHHQPDRVLTALGSRDAERITTLRLARERRAAGRRAGAFAPPSVRGWEVDGDVLRVRLGSDAPTVVRVNGVPLPASSTRKDVLAIPLSPGINVVRIAGADDGAASWLRVRRAGGPTAPRLFVLAVGVSRYAQPAADLRFAADDARHLAATLTQRLGAKTVTRVDAEATWPEVQRAAHALFADAAEGDAAIVFIAGHGVNDGGTYYFAPHEMDFGAPRARGVSFDALDGLFSTTRARQRLLLMDTCFSGPIDAQAAATPVLPPGVIAVDAPRGAYAQKPARAGSADTVVFDTMRELFADLSLGSGAQVIAAASGRQYAFERDGYGVFTGALLDTLAAAETDADRDGELQIGEVQAAVAARVAQSTRGAQVPTSRRDARDRSMSLGRAAGVLARAAPDGSQWLGLDAKDVVHVRAPATGIVERFQAPALTRLAPLTPLRGFDATTLAITPDGRYELRAERDGAHVIEVASGRDRLVLPERRPSAIESVGAFDARGGVLVSWFDDGVGAVATRVGRLDLVTGRMGPTATYGWSEVRIVPDASRFVVLSASGVDVRDADARRIGGVSVPPEHLANVAVSADLRHAVTVDDHDRVTVWSVTTGQAIATWTAPGAGGAQLAVGPEAGRVALASRNAAGGETLTVRDGARGEALVTHLGAGDTFAHVAFTADGRHLVTGVSSGLRVYAVP